MSSCVKVDGIITGNVEIEAPEVTGEIISETPEITGRLSVAGSSDAYPGPYDVIPKVDPQLLNTQGQYMKYDVTVWGIPYTEVSNKYGITVSIGE